MTTTTATPSARTLKARAAREAKAAAARATRQAWFQERREAQRAAGREYVPAERYGADTLVWSAPDPEGLGTWVVREQGPRGAHDRTGFAAPVTHVAGLESWDTYDERVTSPHVVTSHRAGFTTLEAALAYAERGLAMDQTDRPTRLWAHPRT